MSEWVTIKNADKLYEALSTKIPLNMEPKLIQQALTAGATPIVKQIQSNIQPAVGPVQAYASGFPHTRTGTLKRAVYQMRGRQSDVYHQVRIVNVRKGKRFQDAKGGSRDAFYARLVEWGHRAGAGKGKRLIRETTATTKRGLNSFLRRLSSTGKDRIKGYRTFGNVPEHPFVRPAFMSQQGATPERITSRLGVVIENAVKRSRF